MTADSRVTVLRARSELSALALECAELALNSLEPVRLDRRRAEGTRCVLVRLGGRLSALFPFGAPTLYNDLPLVVLRSPAPLLRRGCGEAAVHAVLDWFRSDGEGAALLEIRALEPGGPVYRAFAEVAREREQLVLSCAGPRGTRTLLLGDRRWSELTMSALPVSRWAKRAAASMLYAGGTAFAPL